MNIYVLAITVLSIYVQLIHRIACFTRLEQKVTFARDVWCHLLIAALNQILNDACGTDSRSQMHDSFLASVMVLPNNQ